MKTNTASQASTASASQTEQGDPTPAGRPDYRSKTIGGIRVSLLFGETKVDHFGRAPVVAVSYKDPQGNTIASWFPLHVWQGIPFDPVSMD